DQAGAADSAVRSAAGQSVRVWHGAAPTFDSCGDFADGVGHLSAAAKSYIVTRLGQFYASGSAPAPTPVNTPQATSTPQPIATTATPTSVPVAVGAAGCPCGVFSYSGAPDIADVSDTNAVELGMKF